MTNENSNPEKTLHDIEREELNLLIRKGQKFAVRYTITKKEKRLLGLRSRTVEEEHAEAFELKEPTLAVLDRLSAHWLEMTLDEKALEAGGAETLAEAKRATADNTKRMAQVLAIAVLGEDYHIKTVERGTGRIIYSNDDRELDRLTDLFFHTIKPSELVILCQRITNIANLGDFIGSMRYMSGARTTQRSNRIE